MATITSNYTIQTYRTRTNLHLTNLNLFTPADNKNMKSLWVTKLKLIENQKGLVLQSWILVTIFFQIFTSGSKPPSTKLGFIYIEKIVNLASMSEHKIQAL